MRTPRRKDASETPGGGHVVLVGAGGTIGSHLVPHLGRMPGLRQVTLIDPDVYEPRNLRSQDIVATDVGRSKVAVQARRLRRIRPELEVTALAAAVQDIPVGRLRSAVILACVDNNLARQSVNEAAVHLGLPWIDSGISAADLLARVNVYRPGDGEPCLECAWGPRDYALLEQVYPCNPDQGPPATNAPSSLGALAASLQATECRKLVAGAVETVAAGRQALLDVRHHNQYLTAYRRNPHCRLVDHRAWAVTPIDRRAEDMALAEVFELAAPTAAPTAAPHPAGEPAERPDGDGSGPARAGLENAGPSLRIEGHRWTRRLTCAGCGRTRACLRIRRGGIRRSSAGRCRCGGTMVATGFDLLERLELASLTRSSLSRTLHSIGIRAGDILSVDTRGGDPRRYEIASNPIG